MKFYYEPVSIIMPVLNQLQYTKNCVKSILEKTPEEFEFLIIDNSSTDGTHEYLADLSSKDARFRIITNEKNVGVSKSWNQGIRESKHNIVCIINNDIEVKTRNFLLMMQRVLKENDKIKWVCPKTCYGPKKKFIYTKSHYEQIIYKKGTDLYVVGCAFMMPKSVFDELGYFDEGFDIRYYEDLDYLARIWSSGNLASTSAAIVWHAVGTTSKITSGGDNNLNYFNEKWGNTRYTLKYFMQR